MSQAVCAGGLGVASVPWKQPWDICGRHFHPIWQPQVPVVGGGEVWSSWKALEHHC